MTEKPNNLEYTDQFKQVHEAEQDWLRKRREEAQIKKGNPEKDAVGLAFSGGGIRSATFNLGVLQAFEHQGILKHIDYLSTVSGGGYIGSCYTWLKAKCPRVFPFGIKRKDHKGAAGKVLAWLRAHGKYLTPGGGMNVWSLIAAILTGSIINLAIIIPMFLVVFFLLSMKYYTLPTWSNAPDFLSPLSGITIDGFSILLIFCVVAFICFLVLIFKFVFTASNSKKSGILKEKRLRGYEGIALMYSVLFGVVGTIPYVYQFFAERIEGIMSSITLSGVVMLIGALRGRKGGNEAKGWRSLVLSIGFAFLAYGLFHGFYYLTKSGPGIISMSWLIFVLLLSVILAFSANINHVSMHRFYRNRLMEAYMPCDIAGAESNNCKKTTDHVKNAAKSQWYPYSNLHDSDTFYLCNIPKTDSPYQIINTNMQTVGSENRKLRGRGGDSFFFTPLYSGAGSTGYALTSSYIEGVMSLATAFSISGAAVDPNTFATRSKPVSFIMSLLNIRLGYWIVNPKFSKGSPLIKARPPWYYYMIKEMFGQGLNEKEQKLHLSDGGHFENLGLYELIRRKCRHIIVSDAGADKDYEFGDLAKVIEMVRLDFGAEIDLKVDNLRPKDKDKFSTRPFAKGIITYDDGTKANLWYIKTTLVKDLPEDINSYQRVNPDFPDQTTADQFFDERQFEAYRELGYQLAKQLCMDGVLRRFIPGV